MIHVDPGWYEAYWFTERPRPRRRTAAIAVTRFAVVAAVLCGSAALVEHFHFKDMWQGYQQWERE
jgi:hypothetical protein